MRPSIRLPGEGSFPRLVSTHSTKHTRADGGGEEEQVCSLRSPQGESELFFRRLGNIPNKELIIYLLS
jgi:hypothetical protein